MARSKSKPKSKSSSKSKAKAKPKARPAKQAKRAPTKKPAKIHYTTPGKIPELQLDTIAEQAFEVVYQPGKPRPLATPSHVLEGHSDFVQALAFAPDSKHLASGSEDGTIRIWNVADGTCVKTLTDHDSPVNSVAFTADGRLLSGSDDRTIKVWRAPAYEVVRTLEGHTDFVRNVLPAGPGRALSSGSDGTLRLWDLDTGKCLRVMKHGSAIFALGVTPDGTRAFANSDEYVMQIWDLTTGSAERVLVNGYGTATYPVHHGCPYRIAVAGDGASFVSAHRELVEWDTAGDARGSIAGDGEEIAGVAYAPDRASRVRAHGDAIECTFVDKLETSPGDLEVRAVYGDWLEDRGRLAEATSVRRHGAFRYMFAGSKDRVLVFDLGLRAIVAQAAWPHGNVHQVAVSPDGRFSASGSQPGVIGLWDLDALLRAGMPDRHLSNPGLLAISNEGIALTGGDDGTLRLWTANGARNERLACAGVHAFVAFTRDERSVLVINKTGTLQLFDATTGELRDTARYDDTGETRSVTGSTFLRDGRLLQSTWSGPLVIWPVDPPGPQTIFDGDAGLVTALAVDEEGDVVVTCEDARPGKPMRIALWSLATRTRTREIMLRAETGLINRVAIIDRGAAMRIAIVTSDGLVIVDRDGNVLQALDIQNMIFNQTITLPDGTLLAAEHDEPRLVDVRRGKVVAKTRWEDCYLTSIPGTSRVVLRSNDSVTLVDLATRTRWEPTPLPAKPDYPRETPSTAVSRNGAFLVTTSSLEAHEGAPIVVRVLR